ncbi:MAG TPA: hypothetical protein VH369_12245 [Bryobacteraceae bacterium]
MSNQPSGIREDVLRKPAANPHEKPDIALTQEEIWNQQLDALHELLARQDKRSKEEEV